MILQNFIQKTKAFPVIDKKVLDTFTGSFASHKLQLSRWSKTGKIIPLKRGLYAMPEEQRKIPFSHRWLANTLYSPSYLSLEYMLSWYDMIPERVAAMTSLSTLKNASFTNALGHFSYRSLK